MFLFPVFVVHIFCSIVPCEVKNSVPADPLKMRKRNEVEAELNLKSSTIYLDHGGGVDGYLMRSILQRQFHAFEGIPYGESTAGPLRFKVSRYTDPTFHMKLSKHNSSILQFLELPSFNMLNDLKLCSRI